MREFLCDAISGQTVVEFEYRDRHRVVEPHEIGESRTGNVVLSGYQSGGQAKGIDVPDWRLYRVEEIESLHVTDISFPEPRPKYALHDNRIDTIHCRL